MDTDTLKIKTDEMTLYEGILLQEIASDSTDMLPRLQLVLERLEPGQITEDGLAYLTIGEFNKLLKRVVIAIRDTLGVGEADRVAYRHMRDGKYMNALAAFFGVSDADEHPRRPNVESGFCCDDPECPVRKTAQEMLDSGDIRIISDGIVAAKSLESKNKLVQKMHEAMTDYFAARQAQTEPKLDPALQEKWAKLRDRMDTDS